MLKFLGHQQGNDEIDQHAQCDDAYQDILQGRVHTIPPSFPPLQAITGLRKADERYERYNGHQDDNHIKHAIPPHQSMYYANVRYLLARSQRHRPGALPLPQPAAAGNPAGMAWADTLPGGIPPGGAG